MMTINRKIEVFTQCRDFFLEGDQVHKKYGHCRGICIWASWYLILDNDLFDESDEDEEFNNILKCYMPKGSNNWTSNSHYPYWFVGGEQGNAERVELLDEIIEDLIKERDES